MASGFSRISDLNFRDVEQAFWGFVRLYPLSFAMRILPRPLGGSRK